MSLNSPWPTAPTMTYFALAPEGSTSFGNETLHAVAPTFHGKVFLLVDAANRSATFQFAQTVQSLHLGLLVSAPTGGNLRGIHGGAFFFVHLPHSHLEVDLPLIGYFPATPQPNRGLEPDLPIFTEATDVASGRDPVMAAIDDLLALPNS